MKKNQPSESNPYSKKMLKQLSLQPVKVKILQYQLEFDKKKMQFQIGLN